MKNNNIESESSEMINNTLPKKITVVNKHIVYTLYNVEKDTDTFLEISKIDKTDRIEMATQLNNFLSGSFPKGWAPREMIKKGITGIVNSLNKKDNPVMSLELFKYFGNWATNADVVGKGKRPQSDNASEIMKNILGFKITQKDIGAKTEGEPDYRSGYEIFHNLLNKVFEKHSVIVV